LAAARAGLFAGPEQSQSDLLRRLKFERVIAGETSELFYQIRIVGNRANHDLGGDYEEQAWAASPPKSSPERNEKNALATWLQTFAWML
jgi:hypothetical protein